KSATRALSWNGPPKPTIIKSRACAAPDASSATPANAIAIDFCLNAFIVCLLVALLLRLGIESVAPGARGVIVTRFGHAHTAVRRSRVRAKRGLAGPSLAAKWCVLFGRHAGGT